MDRYKDRQINVKMDRQIEGQVELEWYMKKDRQILGGNNDIYVHIDRQIDKEIDRYENRQIDR